jgi:hypothetical protein
MRKVTKFTLIPALIVMCVAPCGCLGLHRKPVKLDLISFTISYDYEYNSVLTGENDFVFVYLDPPVSLETVPIALMGPVPVEESGIYIPQNAERESLDGKEIAVFTMSGSLVGKRGELQAFAVIQNEKIVIVFSEQTDEHEQEARRIAESLSIRKN